MVKGGYVTKQRGLWAITDEGRAVVNGPYDGPAFFERLVVQLLVTMGYGGNQANPGQVTQLSADNGIDGIINEDKLGLDTIYLQAKRLDTDFFSEE